MIICDRCGTRDGVAQVLIEIPNVATNTVEGRTKHDLCCACREHLRNEMSRAMEPAKATIKNRRRTLEERV